jgi:hypothetical protein
LFVSRSIIAPSSSARDDAFSHHARNRSSALCPQCSASCHAASVHFDVSAISQAQRARASIKVGGG